jgi:hypothetical protein
VIPHHTAETVGDNLRRMAIGLAPWDRSVAPPSVVENHAAIEQTFDDNRLVHLG